MVLIQYNFFMFSPEVLLLTISSSFFTLNITNAGMNTLNKEL